MGLRQPTSQHDLRQPATPMPSSSYSVCWISNTHKPGPTEVLAHPPQARTPALDGHRTLFCKETNHAAAPSNEASTYITGENVAQLNRLAANDGSLSGTINAAWRILFCAALACAARFGNLRTGPSSSSIITMKARKPAPGPQYTTPCMARSHSPDIDISACTIASTCCPKSNHRPRRRHRPLGWRRHQPTTEVIHENRNLLRNQRRVAKTTTAVNLAATLAAAGHETLLIDLDAAATVTLQFEPCAQHCKPTNVPPPADRP